jgi:excisionase family DNA binding protein
MSEGPITDTIPAVKPKRSHRRTGRARGRPAKSLRLTQPLDPSAMALRMDEAAAVLGVSVSLVKRQIANGTIPSVKLGRRTRLIPVAALHELLDKPERGP